MSLINQMLKDLEARQQGRPSGQSVPVLRVKAPGWRRLPLLTGGVLTALLLAGLLLWFLTPETTGRPALASKKSAAAMSGKEPAEAQVPATRQYGTGSPLSATIALNAVRLREIDSFIHFEADFDRPPVYHLTLAKDRRSLHLDLVAVRQAAELPPVVRRRWLAGLQTRQEDTGLAVNLILEPTVTIRDFSATMQVAGTGYRLLLDLYPETPAAALNQPKDQPAATRAPEVEGTVNAEAHRATEDRSANKRGPREVAPPESSGTLVRKTDKPSAEDLAEQAYRRGQMALAAGRNQEGTAALMQALEQHPAHLAARQALVSELLRQQRPAEAGGIMAEGLRLDPTQLSMRLRYAELLMTQGALEKARDLLLQGPPQSPASAPQLHALLGAIYQRLGQYQAAGQEYQALLTSQPDNALWQMGLGIAREHAGVPDEAIVAYRAALDGRGLSPALNNYIRQRLAVLQP
jgi:MSHA biogenesis protein MshN